MRSRKLWVLYLRSREFEIPLAVGVGGPPGPIERREEAARARAALNLQGGEITLRTLPLLCHQGTLYTARDLIFPSTKECVRRRLIRPGEVIRLY